MPSSNVVAASCSLHDALCGPDPAYFSTLVGGAKKHGEVNYTLDAPIAYVIADKADPIMKDMSNLTLFDEAFYTMTWATAIRPSMCSPPRKFLRYAQRGHAQR